jgi:hypothetical protein
MRIWWWQAGLHLKPETKEENEALKSLAACFRQLGYQRGAPELRGVPRSGPTQPEPELGVGVPIEPSPTSGISDRSND